MIGSTLSHFKITSKLGREVATEVLPRVRRRLTDWGSLGGGHRVLQAFSLCAFVFSTLPTPSLSETLAVENAQVVDSATGEVSFATILVVEGRIAWVGKPEAAPIPEMATRIDATGKWVVPGLVELHSHDTKEFRLRRALSLGVTTAHTIVDPGLPLELLQRSADDLAPIPRLLFTSGLFGEFPEHVQPGAYQVKAPASVAEARRDVAELRLRGASAVKIWQDDGALWFGADTTFPPIAPEIYREIVSASQRNRMRVYAHAWKGGFARLAIDSGVDALIHPVIDEQLSDSDFEAMADRGIAWATTMSVVLVYGDPQQYAQRILSDPVLKASLTPDELSRFENDLASPEHRYHQVMPELATRRSLYLKNLRANTRRARDLGVTLALGSDEIVGIATHLEAELMQEAGLSATEVLDAATRGSATALGLEDILGVVEEGYLGDLLVLTSDPRQDVRNLRGIDWVIKGGKPFRPTSE